MNSWLHSLAWIVAVGIASTGAQPVREERFGRPALEFRLHTIGLVYSDQPARGWGALLRGEPFEIDLIVINRNNGPRARLETDWFNRAYLTMRPGRMFDASPAPWIAVTCESPSLLQKIDVEDLGEFLLFGRDGSQVVRCHVNLEHLTLPAGVYTLRVEWGPHAKLDTYPDTFYRQPPFTWDFEYRDVSTEADRLDLNLHQALRALNDRHQPDEALLFINDVLALRPTSTVALSLRADIQMANGACREAVADWQRAIHVLRNRGDLSREPAAPSQKPGEIDEPDDTQRITIWQRKIDRSSCR